MAKRKKYQVKDNGHMRGLVLTHMRDVAYGDSTQKLIEQSRHRTHDENQSAFELAERKRLRRMERNRKRD